MQEGSVFAFHMFPVVSVTCQSHDPPNLCLQKFRLYFSMLIVIMAGGYYKTNKYMVGGAVN